jgi:outer membrane lipoprotein carrier protein
MKSLYTILFFVFPFLLAAQYDPKAAETLKQMSETHKKMNTYVASFSCHIHSEAENIDESFMGKMTVKGNKYRLQMADWQEIYNNGSTVWTYIKTKKTGKGVKDEVTITNYEPETEEINLVKIFNLYQKGFKYVFLQEEKIEAELCEVIDLVPEDREKEYFKIRLWISKKSKELKQFQLFEKSGKRTLIQITQITGNVKLEDNYFNFSKSFYPNRTIQEVDLR